MKNIGRQWEEGIGKWARTEMTLLGYVPPEGVIGYDFFNNFTLVIDHVGGKMVKQCNEISGAFNTL